MDYLNDESTNPIAQSPAVATTQQPGSLVDVVVKDEFVALNVLVSFLQVANKRGCFNLEESAKIWECIKKFTTKK
jgi:hypothetical protein